MKQGKPKSLLVLLMLTGVCWLAAPQAANAAGYPGFTPLRYQQELAFREAGLRGDRSLIPAMIQSLQAEQNPDMRKSILLALAQLGATEALPTIDMVAQISFGKSTEATADVTRLPDVGNFALAARARLVVEATTQDIPDSKARAQAKVERFFRELGKSPAEVYAGAADFHKKVLAGSWDGCKPIESYAMEEMADMIWRGPYADYAALPQVQQMNFTQDAFADPDYPASVKVQSAPLSPDAQRAWLIDRLGNGIGGTAQQQLVLNLGRPEAAELAAAKLQKMLADQKKYHLTSFKALFKVLQISGDTSHEDLWARFKVDKSLGFTSSDIHEGPTKFLGVTHFVSGY